MRWRQGSIYCVFIFSPLSHAIIVLLSLTVYWGEMWQEGNQIKFFPTGHNLFVTVSANFSWGRIYDIFYPCVFIFPS